ncbi:hypothetical protein RHGRI_000574 [Rhododendron griersonianum]|uniref:Protein kinase domain-containing protein n=1 Tax=Rhododendron griersonianum TaxID=479676 RepID=A0AAV6LJZ9_9ERIC|nr:hypothetical protein RHGRI_000574 [Rhododendron griersonianum]
MMNFISAEQTFSYMPPEALFSNAWLQGKHLRTCLRRHCLAMLGYRDQLLPEPSMNRLCNMSSDIFFMFCFLMYKTNGVTLNLIFWFCRYDMWTIGQTITELILGTPGVFTVYTVESTKLATKLLEGMDTAGGFNLILRRIITLSEFCITVPGIQQYSSSDQRLTAQEALNHPYFLGSSSYSFIGCVMTLKKRSVLAKFSSGPLMLKTAKDHNIHNVTDDS